MPSTRSDRPGAAPRSGFIPEIQGLRTVALLLVAIYHVWFDRVSGGVDVFLLVSAYLMTRSLTNRAERRRWTNVAQFLVQKFARLLPAAIAMTFLVLVVVRWLFPASMWSDNAHDAIASVTYTENFRLQQIGTDYFAANDALASPFQHFWSLSIQGQVFAIWAVVHALAELVARATRIPVRRILFGAFALALVGSLAWSIRITDLDQAYAYFDTGARLWEFAAGSLLALVQPWLRLGSRLRSMLGWTGIAGILSCGWVLPVESSFPGWIAAWPVLSAALIIVSAGAPTRAGADRVLAAPVLARIGDYTYALYLTHWPVLVAFLVLTGIEHPNWWQGALILLISAILSVGIHRFVERPVSSWLSGRGGRRARPERLLQGHWVRPSIAVALALAVSLGASAGLLRLSADRVAEQQAALMNADYSMLGANADGHTLDGKSPLQDASVVKGDWVRPGVDCDPDDPHRTELCYEAAPPSGEDPERVVLNIGNSHNTQLAGTLLETIARQPTWTLRTQVFPGCNYLFSRNDDAKPGCVDLWATAAEFIEHEQPDMVVVLSTWSYFDGDKPMHGLDDWVLEMSALAPDTVFVTVRDNPRLDLDPLECSFVHGYDSPQCAGRYVPGDIADFRSGLEAAGGVWVDYNEAICEGTRCAPVRGGVVTSFDDNHLTGSYARTLAQRFADQIRPAVEWWPEDAYAGEYVERAPDDLSIVDDLNK